eukprot:579430-Pyramimonas_sp.AAC.1
MECDRHGCGRNAERAQTTGSQDRAPSSGLQVDCEELGGTEASAITKGSIPDEHALLGAACPRGCGGSLALGGYAEDSG